MSAIPWIGGDIVESKNILEYYTMSMSALILPTVGTVSVRALNKGNKKVRLDKKEYLSIPPAFLAFLVGFIDGDGYIQVTRTPKGFITIKLVIALHLKDISTLEYIKSVLNIGTITTYPDLISPRCRLIINRTDLQEIFFPLLIHHRIFFLTETRRAQFNLAMHIFKENKKVYDTIPMLNDKEAGLTLFKLPSTALGYVDLPFFKNWIVGFTASEGSFLIKINNDGCFQLRQRVHTLLFEAFKVVFKTNRKIGTDKGIYSQFSVSSKTDIQTVINFFSFEGHHPLIGLKNIQYLNWLKDLRDSSRYAHLNYPSSL